MTIQRLNSCMNPRRRKSFVSKKGQREWYTCSSQLCFSLSWPSFSNCFTWTRIVQHMKSLTGNRLSWSSWISLSSRYIAKITCWCPNNTEQLWYWDQWLLSLEWQDITWHLNTLTCQRQQLSTGLTLCSQLFSHTSGSTSPSTLLIGWQFSHHSLVF